MIKIWRSLMIVNTPRSRRPPNTAVTVLDQFVSSLSNFSVAALGLWLPLREYGALALAIVIYVLILGLIRASVLEPLTARDKLAHAGYRALLPGLALTGFCSVALVLASVGVKGPLGTCFGLLGLGLPLLICQDAGRYVAFHRKLPQRAVFADGAWLGLFVIGAGAAATIEGHVRLETLLGAWIVAGTLSSLTLVDLLARRPAERLPVFARFNVGYSLDFVLGALVLQGVQAILGLVLPLSEYGRLRAATTAMSPITVLFTAVTTTLLAAATQRASLPGAPLAGWIGALRKTLLLVVCAYSALLFGGLVGWSAVFPDSVRQSAALLAPVAAGNVVLALDAPVVLKMKALRRQSDLARARAGQAVVMVLAPFVALYLGVGGAAWTLTAGQCLGYGLRVRLNSRADRQRRLGPLHARPEWAGQEGL